MRVLITVAPLSYREVFMLTLRRLRSDLEVIVADPDKLDTETERYTPGLIVCNAATQKVRRSRASWIEILLRNGMDANVCVGETPSAIKGIGIEDLLNIADEAERLDS